MDILISIINIIVGAVFLWFGIRKYNLTVALTVTTSYLIGMYQFDYLNLYTAVFAALICWGWYRYATVSLYLGMGVIIGVVFWLVCMFAKVNFSWILVLVGLALAIGGTYAVRKHLKPIVVGGGGGSTVAMGVLALLNLEGGFTDIIVTLGCMAGGIFMQYFLLKKYPDWSSHLTELDK